MHPIRRYPLSWLCILAIWFLSLCPGFPETPIDDVPFVDKWVHIVMYGGTWAVVWAEYIRRHRRPLWAKLALWALAYPIVMSGCLELLQEYCTGGARNGDWLDLAANATGVALAFAAGSLYYAIRRR